MKTVPLAALLGVATATAQAQQPPARFEEPALATATRAVSTVGTGTLRAALVVTREQIEAAGPITLAELLQRRAGVEFEAAGGAGQPVGLFLRGATAAQTLVLVDGLRLAPGNHGLAALQAIPLEMVERIEVVKGPLSGLYGSGAIGGVVQVFTRGRGVPHLFAHATYGTDNDRRVSAGLATSDDKTAFSFAAGWRKVEARSATNDRSAAWNPDRDPHENAFAVLRASHRRWTGEQLTVELFGSESRTSFDAGDPRDRLRESVFGGRVSSAIQVLPGWDMKLQLGHTRDKPRVEGPSTPPFETRRDEAAWIHEFKVPGGIALAGADLVRERIVPAAGTSLALDRDRRDVDGVFASLNESWQGQRLEANVRRDRDDGNRKESTGSVSWGTPLTSSIDASFTYARGVRFAGWSESLLAPQGLLPERSRSRELAFQGRGPSTATWRITAFDQRIEDLVVVDAIAARNVPRTRIRGLELSAEGRWMGVAWRGQVTAQRPRDEETGSTLRLRAERLGAIEASRQFGPVTAALSVVASGRRPGSNDGSPDERLGGYARVDVRMTYKAAKFWSVEVAALNLGDRRYETALGYDAPRRGLAVTARFDAF